ncbi:hypothetical protein JTE90_027544 [Oedothorax gibbosus]|uniref:F-box domain-containing protein n=1 Tax=Oedothorax gibbosus TaxID=931172 RepID=A0AAV6VJ48_9ARAC|nr:hypothetical protein JTE90_027544 [Oedothorax gibbosus]
MVLREIEMFTTSTPIHRDDSRISSFDRLFSPVSAEKFGTPKRSDSSFLCTPIRRQLRPLQVFKKEVLLFLQNLQHVASKSSMEAKRIFLEDFPSRLISRRAPSFEGTSVKDIYYVLNYCDKSYKIEFSLAEAYKLYHKVRSLQTLSSPFSKMTRHTRDLTNSLEPYPVSKGPEFPSTPVSHRDYVLKTRRSDSMLCSSFNDSHDSGLGSSFSSPSSFYEQIFSPERDILKELNKIDCYEVTSLLLSYLSPKDIQTVSSVSKTWRAMVLDNAAANKRRCDFLIQKMLHSKENKSTAKPIRARDNRVLFQDVSNKQSLPKQPLEENTTVDVFQSFVEMGKNIHKKDILLKCPKCNHPSKRHSDNKYSCTRQFCAYEFCRQCCGPFLANHTCLKPIFNEAVPRVVIGSQKSKRSLRRL